MRIKKVLTLCLSLSFLTPLSFAQQNPENTCDIPVVVTRYDNSLVEDLGPKDFQVQVGAAMVPVESATIDRGPKWVSLIVDASRNIPDEEWKLETGMAAKLLDHARPADRFSFFILGADIAPLPSSDATALKDQLIKLMSSRPPASESNERIYDALLEAIGQRDPSGFGDVIFLFGHHENLGSKADPDQILELMLKKKLRFFGMSYADPFRGKLPQGFDPNKPLPPSLRPKKLEKMANETGNYFSFHAVQGLNQPGQMQLYEGFLGDLYARIAAPYSLRLAEPAIQGPVRLQITVSNLQERHARESGMYYPHTIYPCASRSK